MGRKQGAHGAYVFVGGRGHFVGGDAVDAGEHLLCGSIVAIDIPSRAREVFKGYSGALQFIVGHAVAHFEVYHHLGCDVAEDEGLIGGRYGDADVGSSHAVAILISFISLVGLYRE